MEMIKNKSWLHAGQVYDTALDLDSITHVELPKSSFKCIETKAFAGYCLFIFQLDHVDY